MALTFLRRRGFAIFVTVNVLVALSLLVSGTHFLRLSPRADWAVPFALLAPLLPPCFLSVAVLPRYTSAEVQRRRSLMGHELVAVALCIALTLTVLTAAAQAVAGSTIATAVGRNVLGLTGLAIVGAALLGPVLSWIVPTAAVFLPAVLLPDPTRSGWSALTFVFRTSEDQAAGLSAFLYLVAGVAAVAVVRSRTSGR